MAAVIETFEFKKNTGNIRLCEGSTFRSQWAPYALSSARMVLKRAQPSMDQIKEQYRHIQAGLSDPVEERIFMSQELRRHTRRATRYLSLRAVT